VRILFVSQYFWPENFRINELAVEMAGRGHHITVLTSFPNYPEGTLNQDFSNNPDKYSRLYDVEIIRVPQLLRSTGKFRLILNYISFAFFASTAGLWKLRGRAFDGVFVFQTSPVTVGIPGGLIAAAKRAPMLMWILDCWPETLAAIGIARGRLAQATVGLLVRAIYASADLLLCQSRSFVANVTRYSTEAKFRHFPNWVESVYLAPLPAPSDTGLSFVLLFAGNIGEAQDFTSVVDAMEQVQDRRIILRIVGDGRDLPRLKEMVFKRGLEARFEFCGRHPPESMPGFLAEADALLVSLKKDPLFTMTVPGKVQTYLAAGRPIVAMLDGEGAEVVNASGAGIAVPAGAADLLADAISKVAIMPGEKRLELGRNGRNYALAHYRINTLMDQLEAWFREAATSR
jgi:glycosyltransferase involved in cell wall biosynthesis